MKNTTILLAAFLFSGSLYSATCVPAHDYYPFEGKWVTTNDNGDIDLGMYARISPDGKYVLRSFSGKGLSSVTLMELQKGEKNKVIPFETPLKNEAFPVQGSWRYLVDINGDHYKVSDIISKQKKASKQFKGGITGFYTVAAEMNGSTTANHKIRSLSWPTDSAQTNQGVGVLSNRVIAASISSKGGVSLQDKGSINYMCSNLRSTDGQVMSLPMISMDASEFASMPQNPRGSEPSMRVFKFGADNKSCEKVTDLKIAVSKVTFSTPEQGMLLFYASGSMGNTGNGVYFFDRKVNKLFTLDDEAKRVQADSFPGFTSDGRIVYGAKWQDCDENNKCTDKAGYVVSDPYQSNDIAQFKKLNPELAKNFKECVTDEDIKASSDTQKEVWSYKL